MSTLEVKLGRTRFKSILNSRVIIVDDDSGKGKTYLYNVINRFPANRASVISEHRVIAGENVYRFKDVSDAIIILDEDCDSLSKEQIDETIYLIENTNNIFIILTRENKLSRLAYGVDNIYELVTENGLTFLRKKYKELYYLNSGIPISDIWIEDSTTGYSFFRRCTTSCTSFKGKDCFEKAFVGENLESRLIVFDRVGFGSCMKSFLEFKKINPMVQILDYPSFEGFLLEYVGEDINIGLDVKEEHKLTQKIQQVLPQYGKSLECDCLLKCKHCKTCNYHDKFYNSKKILNESRYSNYLEVK